MIQAKHISFGYSKRDPILNNLSLDLNQPGIYGLLGKNGAGKTTLLKLLAGSLFPSTGEVHINNILSTERDLRSLQHVYYLSDSIESPNWTANQIAKIYGKLYPNFDNTLFQHALATFEVQSTAKRQVLSMGQQKKLEIAFALATQTPYIFMDEPTNGLDILAKKQFRRLVSQSISDTQTLIISSHQFREIDQLIDHLLILHDKNLVFNKSIVDIGIQFLFSNDPQPEEQLLYQDEGTLGKYGLYNNPHKRESSIDIELLFTAICKNPIILDTIESYENHY